MQQGSSSRADKKQKMPRNDNEFFLFLLLFHLYFFQLKKKKKIFKMLQNQLYPYFELQVPLKRGAVNQELILRVREELKGLRLEFWL